MKLRLHSMFLLLAVSLTQSAVSDKQVLDKILQRANETHSTSVLIIKDGKTVGEYYVGDRNERIQLMSCTKSIVSLAIGKLIDDGKIKSLDQPVHEFHGEWKQGKKASVTIRHLLNHTSGMQNVANAGMEVESSKDVVKLALDAELSDEPGTRFHYNNKAVNLLAGIVERASGKRLDVFMRDEFFSRMRIEHYGWIKDPAGNPYAHFGLQLSARDFAKFGELVLNRGKWNGVQIISEKWIDAMLAQSQPFNESGGLLWWRTSSAETYTIDDEHLATLERAGVERSFLEKLQTIKGKHYQAGERTDAVRKIFGTDWQKIVSSQELGNKNKPFSERRWVNLTVITLTAIPDNFWLSCLETRPSLCAQVKQSTNYDSKTDGFEEFISLVLQLEK